MRTGWGPRRRFRRTATALVALTLLPVAMVVASAHAASPAASLAVHAATLRMEDVDLPAVEALQRSEASNLFAPFVWNGESATGPFVRFSFSQEMGTITDYTSVNTSASEVLIPSIQVDGFYGAVSPQVAGPIFTVNGVGITLVAHQEPMGLLEMETAWGPRTVVFTFAAGSSALALSHATTWPRSTLSFSVGDSQGSIILWKGTMSLNGTKVTAVLGSGDYLALRIVPSFANDRAQRTAILDAFGSGRLAAEYDLVAMTNGGWLENAAQYQPNVTLSSDGVDFNDASLTMNALGDRGGLLLLAFDPRTMPSDAGHKIVVLSNGAEIPEAADPLSSLYAAPSSSSGASFSQLSMNATVLVVYLPALTASSLEVQSIVLPPGGIDGPTELAMVAAAFVVSVAAAVMFRPRRE